MDMTNDQILLLIGLVDQHRDTPFFPDGTPWGSAVIRGPVEEPPKVFVLSYVV